MLLCEIINSDDSRVDCIIIIDEEKKNAHHFSQQRVVRALYMDAIP